jgi:H+/Cl- antiporter ClcA
MVTVLGYSHGHRPALKVMLSVEMFFALLLAGVAFGLCATTFVQLSHAVRTGLARWVTYPPFRQLIGGTTVLALSLFFGRDYLGLSVPLADQALLGLRVAISVCALKLLFTAVTYGSGIPGGEVTPLFVMGATLGAAIAEVLGLSVPLAAGVGFVAVFAGAAKTPIACTIMAAEYFGPSVAIPAAIACIVSVVVSGPSGIYSAQRSPQPRERLPP